MTAYTLCGMNLPTRVCDTLEKEIGKTRGRRWWQPRDLDHSVKFRQTCTSIPPTALHGFPKNRQHLPPPPNEQKQK